MAIILHDLCGANDERFSPFCWRAKMALALKGLDVEARPVGFTGIGNIADGKQKTVPVIEDGDRIVSDSFAIARYLEETYPDRPTLFGGAGGLAMCRFVDSWAGNSVAPHIGGLVVKDVHDRLTPADQTYFRTSREARYGKPLEEVQAGRENRIEAFHKALDTLRRMLDTQPFIGGESPLYADFIVFGFLQWASVAGKIDVLPPSGDPVRAWHGRCLDLYKGSVRKAA